MNHYEPPKENPERVQQVTGLNQVELTIETYHAAKLQNRIRFIIMALVATITFLIMFDTFGDIFAIPSAIVLCLASYLIVKPFLPLADMTSTIKFKKYGEQMKLDAAKAKFVTSKKEGNPEEE